VSVAEDRERKRGMVMSSEGGRRGENSQREVELQRVVVEDLHGVVQESDGNQQTISCLLLHRTVQGKGQEEQGKEGRGYLYPTHIMS
jgi:hypothetical protein